MCWGSDSADLKWLFRYSAPQMLTGARLLIVEMLLLLFYYCYETPLFEKERIKCLAPHLITYKDCRIFLAWIVCCSLYLLTHQEVIDQTPITRHLLAQAMAQQFFGCFISMNSWLVFSMLSFLLILLRFSARGRNV